MFFFFHLVTGMILGFLIGDLLHDRRWVIPCTIGAVLPDLIDKPLGHIIFAGSIGYGRIYGHTLLFFLVLLVIGLIVWKLRKTPIILALSVGVFTHSILDLMWLLRENWFYPFMGPFRGELAADYFLTLFTGELGNPAEIFLAIVLSLCLILYIVSRRPGNSSVKYYRLLKGILGIGAVVLLIISGIFIGLALVKKDLKIMGWHRPEELLIVGIVMVLASLLLWRWHAKRG
ncbi:MAG: metal-dependent hydrolase [Methanoregula sp.]|nr:metal-dependent hydrolase [Methanoregula sp.]